VGRISSLLAGALAGVLCAGVGAAVLIPLLPQGWRSEWVVWASTAALVAACVGAAFLMSRPARE
jgi:hypothetical protein